MEKFNGDIRRYDSLSFASVMQNRSFRRLILANFFMYYKYQLINNRLMAHQIFSVEED